MSEWKEYKLEDVAELRREKFTPNETTIYPYIGLEHIEPKSLRLNGIGSSNDVSSQKSVFYPNDTLYGKLRPYFQKVYSPDFKGVCSTDIFVVKPKKGISPKFLFCLLASDEFTNISNQGSTGTRMPRADWNHLKTTEWNIPPLPTQTAIAEILSSLDDKIELNNKINQELEALAQALFKQWFIDFEFHCLPENYIFSGAVKPKDFDKVMTYRRVGGLPVPDGKHWFVYVLLCDDHSFYKGITNDLYRRFYEHYTGIGAEHTKKHRPIKVVHWEQYDSKEQAAKRESDLKTGYGRTWISRQVEKAGGIDALLSGSPAPKVENASSIGLLAPKTELRMAGEMVDSELGEIPKGWEVVLLSNLLTVKYGKDHKHLSDGIYPLYGSGGIMRYVERPLYHHSSILIPRKGTLSNLFYLEEPFWSVDTMFYTEIHNPIFGKYLFHCIKALDIASMNVGSAVPSMTTKVLNELKVLSPNILVMQEFDNVLSGFYNSINQNKNEIEDLKNLRDTLLPKLISGELEIKETEENGVS